MTNEHDVERDGTVEPHGYDFFADLSGARSLQQSLDAAIRFQPALTHLERLEQTVAHLPSRLQALHGRGARYPAEWGAVLTHISARLQREVERSRTRIARYEAQFEPEVAALGRQVAANDAATEADGYDPHAAAIVAAKAAADALKVQVDGAEEAVQAGYREVANEVRAFERQVVVLERAAELLDGASFTLEGEEALVDARAATFRPARGREEQGTLFLTDRRLIFEQNEMVERRAGFLPLGRARRQQRIRWSAPVAQLQIEPGDRDLRLRARDEEVGFQLAGREAEWRERIEAAKERSEGE